MTKPQLKKLLNLNDDYVIKYNTGDYYDHAVLEIQDDKLIIATGNGIFEDVPKKIKLKDFKIYKAGDWI